MDRLATQAHASKGFGHAALMQPPSTSNQCANLSCFICGLAGGQTRETQRDKATGAIFTAVRQLWRV